MTNILNLARLDFIRSTVFLLLWMPFHSYGQIQVGQDLDGKSQGLKAGVNCAISQDGNRLVYSEQFSNGLNTGDGSLFAYEWNPSIQEWAPLGDTVHGAGLMYQLGSFSVAMSGDGRSIAGGTPFTGNTQRGIVQTYRLNSLGVWDTLGGFLMGANNFDQIGRSIAFNYNGNILAVSAENTSWGNQAGYIKVFELDSINNMWVQVGMTLQGLNVGEKFGHQIDLNDEGDVLVVGIPFRGPSLKGAVQVFRRDSTNNWVQQGSTLDRGIGYIQFGNTVSMNSEGNMIVAGSWGSANAYKAYVYKWNNTTLNWSQFGPIINPAASWREWCYDVEMDSSGYIIAVSSIFDEEARVYQYNSGSNTWGLIPSNISGRVSGDDFGGCLDLSGDGQRLIVGAPTDGLHFIEGGNVAVFSDYCSNMTKFSLSDCDSVILPNGMSVKTSGFHYDTLVNVRGCDSILRYSLLIKQPSSAIQYDTSCVSFTSNSGVLYTQSGVFQEHFTNQVGCDSTLYLHINIPYLDTSIYLNAPYLVSAAQNVTYQWYDCNSQAVILGETNVNFLPSNNGSYAVIIEKDGCSDTSNCFNLVNFGQIELTENVIVYPNPVSETIRIQYEGEIQTELVNSIGQKVLSTNKKEFDVFHLQRGLYTVVLVTGNGSVHVRKLVIK